MIDITLVLEVIVALVTAVAATVAVPWLHSKFDNEEMTVFLRWVEIAVAAAEQLYATTASAEKKEYVLKFLQSKGYTVKTADIENAVEAAVLKLHTELQKGEKNG